MAVAAEAEAKVALVDGRLLVHRGDALVDAGRVLVHAEGVPVHAAVAEEDVAEAVVVAEAEAADPIRLDSRILLYIFCCISQDIPID